MSEADRINIAIYCNRNVYIDLPLPPIYRQGEKGSLTAAFSFGENYAKGESI